MNTTRTYRGLYLILLVTLFLSQACTKKCQPPATEKFKTFTGQQWRLVETTDRDPAFKNLSNTTFLIWEFGKDYTGKINVVQNNKLYDTPVVTFDFNVAPSSNEVVIKFTPTSGTQSETQSDGVLYDYELNREFELVNADNGAYYRFVQYVGIVDPDNECEF